MHRLLGKAEGAEVGRFEIITIDIFEPKIF